VFPTAFADQLCGDYDNQRRHKQHSAFKVSG
jgi:hypothetical protein